MAKKYPQRRVRKKAKKRAVPGWLRTFGISAVVLALFSALVYHYREGLLYYFSFKTHQSAKEIAKEKRISEIRNYTVLVKNPGKSVGIDVSEYQGEVAWQKIKNIEGRTPISFVFIRATAGNDRPDACFRQNWSGAKKQKLIRGAYHYYRPNENSIEQAELFIKTVRLKKGDLPPVLDIEKLPKQQSLDSLKVGLKRWLNKIEAYYGVKPIIYTGEKYYKDFLHEEFREYPFWIANYNIFVETIKDDWLFWQFTEKATVDGVSGKTDVNIFNGGAKELRYLTIGN